MTRQVARAYQKSPRLKSAEVCAGRRDTNGIIEPHRIKKARTRRAWTIRKRSLSRRLTAFGRLP